MWKLLSSTSISGTNTTELERNVIYPNIDLSIYKEILLSVSYYKASDGYLVRNSVCVPSTELWVQGNNVANWIACKDSLFGSEIIVRDKILTETRAYLLNTGTNHSGYTCYAKLFVK